MTELNSLFATLKKHAIPTLVVLNPQPETRDSFGFRKDVVSATKPLVELADSFTNVQLHDPWLEFYPVELTESESHLRARGAIRHSRELSKEVERILNQRSIQIVP
jgi:hypothetical protein